MNLYCEPTLIRTRIILSTKKIILLLLLPLASSTTENISTPDPIVIENHIENDSQSESGSNDIKHEEMFSMKGKEGRVSKASHSIDVDLDNHGGLIADNMKKQPLKGAHGMNEDYSTLAFWPAFVNSLSMIIATEIGDKTFFIAAVMSMKHDCVAVFSGAILALIVMTVLSSLMGLVLPQLMPRQYTHFFGAILFLYFGVRLIQEGRSIPKGKCSDELEEVEEELKQGLKKGEIENDDVEKGKVHDNVTSRQPSLKREKVFMQAFTLTFLAEWGDRSQIATIALAASKDPIGVNIGAILGHSLCTGMAVIGGRIMASKIEERTVTILSGVIFLCFGVHALFLESV